MQHHINCPANNLDRGGLVTELGFARQLDVGRVVGVRNVQTKIGVIRRVVRAREQRHKVRGLFVLLPDFESVVVALGIGYSKDGIASFEEVGRFDLVIHFVSLFNYTNKIVNTVCKVNKKIKKLLLPFHTQETGQNGLKWVF